MAESYTIVFQPSGRRGEVPSGTTVLAAAQELGVGIEAVCGGKRVCGKCRVIIEEAGNHIGSGTCIGARKHRGQGVHR